MGTKDYMVISAIDRARQGWMKIKFKARTGQLRRLFFLIITLIKQEVWRLTNVIFSGTLLWRDNEIYPKYVPVSISHPIFYGMYVLPLSHQHQVTMIKTIDHRWAKRGKNLVHHRRKNYARSSKKLDTLTDRLTFGTGKLAPHDGRVTAPSQPCLTKFAEIQQRKKSSEKKVII